MREKGEAGYLLRSLKDINKEIQATELEIERVRSRILNITQRIKTVSVQASTPADPVGDAFVAIEKYELMLKEFNSSLIKTKTTALAIIKKMPYSNQLPLTLYYLQDYTMEETAERLGVSIRQGWTKLKQSEKIFEDFYNKDCTKLHTNK